jgi:spore coat polysaccharide biosynthesis protein SpsF (cytidylyltransferase family)
VRERFSRRNKLRPWDWSSPSENVPFRELITTIQNLWLIAQEDLMDDRLAKFVYDFCIESNRPYLDYIESYRIWRNYRVDLLIKSLKDTKEAFDFIEAVYEHLSEKYKKKWRERINEKLEDFNTLYRLNEE